MNNIIKITTENKNYVVSSGDLKAYINVTKKVLFKDPEFERKAVELWGKDKGYLTTSDLDKITNEEFKKLTFKNNSNIKYTEDTGLFKNVNTIPVNFFYGCKGIEDIVVTENIKVILNLSYNGCTNAKTLTIIGKDKRINNSLNTSWGSQAFSNLPNISGLVDLSGFSKISAFHEFDSFGKSGTGVLVIMPKLNGDFGVWFASSKITSMAESKEKLENNIIKIPKGGSTIIGYAFGAMIGRLNIIVPEGYSEVLAFASGDGSWVYWNSIDLPSTLLTLSGPFADANFNGNYTITCRAVVPPKMKVGGIGWGGNYEYKYPIMGKPPKAIYVPAESVEAYKNNSVITKAWINENTLGDVEIGWKRFADKILAK